MNNENKRLDKNLYKMIFKIQSFERRRLLFYIAYDTFDTE